MTVDDTQLANLQDAVERYHDAAGAWQRRLALDVYRATATPDLVGALIDEYRADAPANAELDDIAEDLRFQARRLEAFGTNHPEAAGYIAVIAITGEHIERNHNMAFILQDGQQVELSVTYADQAGNPAEVETQTWSSSDDTIITVTDNGDGTAVAEAVTVGAAQIQLVADARFGEDVSEIRGVLDIEVVAAEAVTATITPGEPTDGADTPPAG